MATQQPHRFDSLATNTAWGRRHPQLSARLRYAAGAWLLVLTGLFYGYGDGAWWTPLLVLAALANFFLAYRGPRAVAEWQRTHGKPDTRGGGRTTSK